MLARQQLGDGVGAETVLRRTWGNMLAKGPQSTIWEFASAQGNVADGFDSLAHGWSSGAIWGLTSGTLGVEPLTPGFQQFAVDPTPGDLTWARGRVPTPAGTITVHWSHTGGDFRLTVTVPPGTTARVGVPTGGPDPVVRVDGQLVWAGGQATTAGIRRQGTRVVVTLGPGAHALQTAQPTT